MTTSLATLRIRLAEAEEALHRLATGKGVQSLSHTIAGTNAVTYTAADMGKLQTYIAQLEAKIALQTGIGRRRCFYIT